MKTVSSQPQVSEKKLRDQVIQMQEELRQLSGISKQQSSARTGICSIMEQWEKKFFANRWKQ